MLGFLKILLIVVLPNLFPDWTHIFCFTVDDILAEVSSLKALSCYRARDFYDAYLFYSIWQQGNWGDEELFDQNCYWAVCSKAKSIKCIKKTSNGTQCIVRTPSVYTTCKWQIGYLTILWWLFNGKIRKKYSTWDQAEKNRKRWSL